MGQNFSQKGVPYSREITVYAREVPDSIFLCSRAERGRDGIRQKNRDRVVLCPSQKVVFYVDKLSVLFFVIISLKFSLNFPNLHFGFFYLYKQHQFGQASSHTVSGVLLMCVLDTTSCLTRLFC